MKEIILIRHSKSAWDQDWLSDFERVLAPRGIKECHQMGLFFSKKVISPDLFLVSTSFRTLQSEEILQNYFTNYTLNTIPELYHASANMLKEIITKIPENFSQPCILAHNPGIEDLLYQSTNQLLSVQTSTWFSLKSTAMHWSLFFENKVQLSWLKSPKNIDYD